MMNTLTALAVSLMTVPAGDRGDPVEQAEFPLDPGWTWMIEPVKVGEDWHEGAGWRGARDDVTLRVRFDEWLEVQLRFTIPEGDCAASKPAYRPMLFRPDRTPLRQGGWGEQTRDGRAVRNINFADVDGPEDIGYVGVAILTLEGRRERARMATQRAKELGAMVPPLPVVGEPYEFVMPLFDADVAREAQADFDGKADEHDEEQKLIRSEDLHGKVVVFDFWATWCGPCMDKMPNLRQLHEEFSPRGLVIIGINMDRDAETARRAVQENKLNWHHVYAPDAARGDDGLWNEITDITSLPTMFIIDHEGVLREVFWPQGIKERFERYIGELQRRAARPNPDDE
jgi:thiol-disulfide isomerase/thioredoxin